MVNPTRAVLLFRLEREGIKYVMRSGGGGAEVVHTSPVWKYSVNPTRALLLYGDTEADYSM